jgi:perosamine synthetase
MIRVGGPWLDADETREVLEALESGWIARGEKVAAFERGLAAAVGVAHARAVASGTAALEAALSALDVRGREVVTTAASCVATVNAILHAGARPVFVDVEPDTSNMRADEAVEALSPRTAAVVAVHLYGHPVDLGPILKATRARGIPLLEDCAQALGACWHGRLVGSIGAAGVFSFYANKLLTTAEGGAVVTSRLGLARRIEAIRDHGQAPGRRFHHTEFGHNFKLSNLHAAVGVAQLRKLGAALERRRANAALLTALLTDIPDLTLPVQRQGMTHAYFAYTLVTPSRRVRDALAARLAARGIESRPMFGPMSDQPFYRRLFGRPRRDFPAARRLGARGLYVGCWPGLERAEIERIAEAVREGMRLLDRRGSR